MDGRAIFPALIGDLGAIISTRDKKEEEVMEQPFSEQGCQNLP